MQHNTLAEQGRLLCRTCILCTQRAQIVETEPVVHLFGTGPNHGDCTCRAMYIVENITQNRET